jgi:transposase
MREKNRIEVLQQVLSGDLQVKKAALLLKRSERTIYRMCLRLRKEGPSGLVHGLKNKPSPRRTPPALLKRALELAERLYSDANDTHLRELLAKKHNITVGHETLRQALRAAGRKPKLRRRPKKHRSRRERKAALGNDAASGRVPPA